MKIVENKRLDILNQVNLGSLLENTKPQTFKGSELHKHLVERLNSGRELTISEIASISASCYRLTEDTNMYQIGTSITETFSTSLDSLLIFCIENIQRGVEDKNHFAESLQEKLVSLLEMEQLKDKQNAIRNGLLNPFKTVHESVGMIMKMCEVKTKTTESTATFEAYNPIAYSELGSQNTTYIKLHGATFGITESKVFPTKHVPSSKFESLSNTIQEMKYDEVTESFVYNNRLLGTFKVSKDGIKHNENVYESNNEFVNKLGVIVESKSDNQRERITHKHILESLLSVKMNMDSFVSCDNVIVVENKHNGEKFAVFLLEDNAFVSVLKSVRYPNITTEYKSVTEMVEVFERKSGFNLSHLVSEQLVKENKLEADKKQIVEGFNTVIGELEQRRMIITGNINEARAKGEFKREQNLVEALAVVDSLIVEQKQNFSEQL